MTLIKVAHVSCDHDGCDESFTIGAPYAAATRAAAHLDRWRCVNGRDYCPRHAAERDAMSQ